MPPSCSTNPRSGCTGPPANTTCERSSSAPPWIPIWPNTSPSVYSEGRLTIRPIAPSLSCWQISATLREKLVSARAGSAMSNWLAKGVGFVGMATFYRSGRAFVTTVSGIRRRGHYRGAAAPPIQPAAGFSTVIPCVSHGDLVEFAASLVVRFEDANPQARPCRSPRSW